VFGAAEDISISDIGDEVVLHPLDDTTEWQRLPGTAALERPETTAAAIELVAAGIGVVIVPQSLARLHHRRDLTYRPVTDAPGSSIALVWPEANTTEFVDEFIGIVRGRTANSSRGMTTRSEGATAAEKKKATKKTVQSNRNSSGGGRGASGGRSGKPGTRRGSATKGRGSSSKRRGR